MAEEAGGDDKAAVVHLFDKTAEAEELGAVGDAAVVRENAAGDAA